MKEKQEKKFNNNRDL